MKLTRKFAFCILFVLLILELSSTILLIADTILMNKKYAQFMKESLENGYSNYGIDKYPYILNENESSLCKEIIKNPRNTKQLTNAPKLRDDLALHSQKWRLLYLVSFWVLWLMQIIALLDRLGIIYSIMGDVCFDTDYFEIILLNCINLTLFQYLKTYFALVLAFLSSIFIAYNFEECMLFSGDSDPTKYIFVLKVWGIWDLILGCLVFLGYIYLTKIQIKGNIFSYVKNSKNHLIVLLIKYIIFGLISLLELLTRLAYYSKFGSLIKQESAELLITYTTLGFSLNFLSIIFSGIMGYKFMISHKFKRKPSKYIEELNQLFTNMELFEPNNPDKNKSMATLPTDFTTIYSERIKLQGENEEGTKKLRKLGDSSQLDISDESSIPNIQNNSRIIKYRPQIQRRKIEFCQNRPICTLYPRIDLSQRLCSAKYLQYITFSQRFPMFDGTPYIKVLSEGKRRNKYSRRMLTQECIVCLEEIGDYDKLAQIAECGHIFHALCLKQWVEYDKNSCPFCNKKIFW